MSKASQLADLQDECTFYVDGHSVAHVDGDGSLMLKSIGLGGDEALKLADWIKETFGDP